MILPRALRILGYALCIVILTPELIGWGVQSASPHGGVWLACYGVFVVGFHVGASAPRGARGARLSWAAIGMQEAAMIAMGLVAPCQFAALALVVVALQAALFLSPMALAAGLGAQTVLVSALGRMRGCGAWTSVSWILAMCGFQAAVAVAVLLARREAEARRELARANAELGASRALLAEASRAEERGRIARELHDVLGHNLRAALGLQLEGGPERLRRRGRPSTWPRRARSPLRRSPSVRSARLRAGRGPRART